MIALEAQKLLCLWVYASVMHLGQGGQFLFIYPAIVGNGELRS